MGMGNHERDARVAAGDGFGFTDGVVVLISCLGFV